jgi:hypothetical protein
MVSMAHNWLASAELPSSYWFYAIKCTAEVCNYFPFKMEDGSYSTPFELVHHTNLIFKFSSTFCFCCRSSRKSHDNLGKFALQSLPMITIGKCPNSEFGWPFILQPGESHLCFLNQLSVSTSCNKWCSFWSLISI